ncbi:uncharacterized protein ARMOST_07812 [Armillaria ostoyae]|uniref:Uncharacterized protein n=1 Tax=Armillaria ostoyae TaxID=47428 RepID=A0A284R6V8_ARMOS|nr:uncharacterized protein ARMOST_07812 [Armillaria ostoyae]
MHKVLLDLTVWKTINQNILLLLLRIFSGERYVWRNMYGTAGVACSEPMTFGQALAINQRIVTLIHRVATETCSEPTCFHSFYV